MARLVLLADDDQIVRSVIQDVLGREGFLVLPACSGEEALDFLHELAAVDLVVTDVYMGNGMDGIELAERTMEMRPGTPILVISAYFESFPMAFGKELPHLAKPVFGRRAGPAGARGPREPGSGDTPSRTQPRHGGGPAGA